MSAPRIKALIYAVRHSQDVDYDSAIPLRYEHADFSVVVNNGRARFELKKAFVGVEAAQLHLSDFIRSWEFSAAMDRRVHEFELAYLTCELEEVVTSSGSVTINVGVAELLMVSDAVTNHVGRSTYPAPTAAVSLSVDHRTELLAQRYFRFVEGRESLAAMAYFCLTVLEADAGGRSSAEKKFFISSGVASALGRLSGSKGGVEARKAVGATKDYSPTEREWIAAVVKRLVFRSAEVAGNPTTTFPDIKLSDFPKI